MKSFFPAYVMCGILLLSGCSEVLEMPVGSPATEEEIQILAFGISQYELTDHDFAKPAGQVMDIDLSNLGESKEGVYSYDGRVLSFHAPGDYRLSGALKDGSIYVDVYEDETVRFYLHNVEIQSGDGAAFYIENAAKVVLTMEAGTVNSMSADSDREENRQACIFSNVDLTINGNGLLSVYSYHADGVRSKDQLKLVNTNLYVKAKKDGLRGNDGVIIQDSVTEVECEENGILSNSHKDMVIIQGGSLKVIAGTYAISSTQYVSIHDTLLDLYSVLEAVRCEGIRDLDEELIQ